MSDRACMAILKAGEILLVHQTYRGESVWTLPGGGIASGESPEAAAVREVREETSLDTRIVRLLYSGPRKMGTGVYYCFLGHIVGGQPRLGKDPELSDDTQELHELCWWRLDAVSAHREVSLILPKLTGEAEQADWRRRPIGRA